MSRPGKVTRHVLSSLTKKPATINYPRQASPMPKGFRGKLKFNPDLCIGCRMCMRDCPTGAIEIRKVADKTFEAVIDLGKCIYCGQCADSCIKKAIQLTGDFELAELDYKKLNIIFKNEPSEGSSQGQAKE